jgi:hypothetical protein
LTKESKTYVREKTASSIIDFGVIAYLTCRRLKLEPCLSPSTKINSTWIKGLNVRPETLKHLGENTWSALDNICIGNFFLNRTSIAQEIKSKN